MNDATGGACIGAGEKVDRFIALIEGRAPARESLRRSMQSALSLPVVTYSTPSELEHDFRHAAAELVVLSLADVDNAAIANTLDLLSKRLPKVPVIVLAQADDVDLARTAIRHGAKGFIPNTMYVAIAIEAMRFVLASGTFAQMDCLCVTAQPSTEAPQNSRTSSVITVRFWVEAGLSALCGFLAVLTLFNHPWIEALGGFNPDNNNGSFEWAIVTALFLVCILLSIAARADWRRLGLPAHAGI
jgi:DNA-binding NarL/FixJ family response regulator